MLIARDFLDFAVAGGCDTTWYVHTSDNGSEKGRIPSNQSGRNQVAFSRCEDWGMIRPHYAAFICVDICSLGHAMRPRNCQPRPKVCRRLDLNVMMLLHICLIPHCGGPACGGVVPLLYFSPEALLQLSASKLYSK